MTRRASRSSSTHVQRTQSMPPLYSDPEKERDFLMRRHQMLRRAAGFMLAKKYRSPWYAGPSSTLHGDALRTKSARMGAGRKSKDAGRSGRGPSPPASSSSSSSTAPPPPPPGTLGVLSKLRGYTREELINFWKDLPPVAKRALLRIHRDVYLTALDQYLVRQNLCCECHDNVLAEWEDLERRRSGSRSLQDVFSVFPPFLDDEDDDEDDDEEEEDEDEDEDEEDEGEDDDEEDEDDDEEDACDACRDGDECDDGSGHCHHHHHRQHHRHELDEDLLDRDDELMDEDEEVMFNYELEGDQYRRPAARRSGTPLPAGGGGSGSDHLGLLSDEYLAALEVGKRQEDELLRLIQKEERYIIIREDHSEFIMDLIRCGEQFSSYLATLRPMPSYDDALNGYDDGDDDAECPGANTPQLAQEYLLEVLAIKFREQLESAYQAALQHSLAVQAELLREEIAELQRDQKQQQQQQQASAGTSSKSKKRKDKKKKKKKAEVAVTKGSAATNGGNNQTTSSSSKNAPAARRASDNQNDGGSTHEASPAKTAKSRRERSSSAAASGTKSASSNQREHCEQLNNQEDDRDDGDRDGDDRGDDGERPEEEADELAFDAVDREVEEFRLLLEKINAQQKPRKSKPKLVLPPGAFTLTM